MKRISPFQTKTITKALRMKIQMTTKVRKMMRKSRIGAPKTTLSPKLILNRSTMPTECPPRCSRRCKLAI